MKNKTFAVVLIAIVFLSGLWATASTPATVVAEPGDVFVDTPTAEPPTPTATWSGKLFLPIGRGDVTPTPTATPPRFAEEFAVRTEEAELTRSGIADHDLAIRQAARRGDSAQQVRFFPIFDADRHAGLCIDPPLLIRPPDL